jgi:3-methyladenine DNA glycosylase AlkC
MAETLPFKVYFGVELAHLLAEKVQAVHPTFPARAFLSGIEAEIAPLELKARVKLLAERLRATLPPDYPEALAILLSILGPAIETDSGMFNQGYFVYPIAQFVEAYGLDHFDLSLPALYEITQRFSSEFAVRPYLQRYPQQTMALLHQWAHDPSFHVRRWVSEGTRPRLPWGMRLQAFVRDPEPVLALLAHLKDDPSAYVRKSVANNLNDITKDHPDRVLEVLREWVKNGSAGTQWIAQHALRTLIKRGHPAALALIGSDAEADAFAVEAFSVMPTVVHIGETLTLRVNVKNTAEEAHQAVIDYVVRFVKANGKTGTKVFKWSKRLFGAGEAVQLQKTLPLRHATTRTLYPGHHEVEVQINGQRLARAAFDLEA